MYKTIKIFKHSGHLELFRGEGIRSRDRPKLTCDEWIMHDLLNLHLSEDMIGNKSS